MLSLLLELFVSLVLCGVFVFFAFLNAPAEAGLTADEEAAAVIGAESAYEPALLPTNELPLFSLLSRCVDLREDAPCGIAYRWVLMSALHYTAREVYSEAHLREWDSGVGDHDEEGQDGGGETESGQLPSRTGQGPQQQQQSAAARGSTPPAGASARRARRRPRRGGPPLSAAPPTPLRRESAHWVNVVLRWAAFLCLGGGTVRPEVWTDHLLFHTEKVLNAVNASYAEKMRARAALVRMLGNQLNGGGGGAAPQRPLAPQHLHSNTAASHFSVAKPLVRVEQMELGAGLLGGPSRELRRTQPMSTTAGAAGDGSALPGSLSPALSAAVSGATALTSPTLAHTAAPLPAGVLSGGGAAAAPSSAATAGAASSPSPLQTPPPPHNSAIAAAGVMLTSSVVGLGGVLADVVASVTTANPHGVGGAAADSAAMAAGGPGSLAGEYASTSCGGGGGTGMSGGAGAQLGIVLPRVEGDVISVEEPFSGAGSSDEGGPVPPPAPNSSSYPPSQHPLSRSVPSSPQPQALPLRCFAIPLFYSDQRFHLRLGCCLPLGALLPVALCVPPDVLTLDCAVAVRRIIFNGHLHAALHGARVELSFPVAPQFTAAVAVTPDYNSSSSSGSGLRDVHGSGNITPGYPSGMYGGAHPPQQQQHYFHSTLPSAGAAAGAARTLGHTFTAINTTRNEATAVRESGGVRGREGSPSVRPPQQQQHYQPPPTMPSPSGLAFTPRSNAYNTPHYTTAASSTLSSSATATGTSSINERNEKVQEVVLLAVRRVIESLTYPNVLAGQLVCLPAGVTESSGTLSMKWQRTTATLPLRL